MNKKWLWMLFRSESNFAYYFYNGEFPVLVHLPEGSNPAAYYWSGTKAEMAEVEGKELDKVMAGKQRVFKISTRKDQRFIVVQRGEFITE